MKCTYIDLIQKHKSIDYLCKTAALKLCAEKQEILNFFELYWCGFEGNPILFNLFCIVAIYLIFSYTAIAVDEYIAEGITDISDWLGFSETLAAVTLLAFANGAGDVITALVASGTDGGISYNIGALFGAGMFVCAVVVAICIFQEGEMVFDKMIIYRDIGIYWIATVLTILFAVYGTITWWNSSILLVLYLVLVVVVVIEEGGKENDEDGTDPDEMKSLVELENDKGSKIRQKLVRIISSQEFLNYKKRLKESGEFDMSKKKFGRTPTLHQSDHMSRFLGVVRQVKYGLYVRKKLEARKEHREVDFMDKDVLGMIFEITEWPFLYTLYLTVLPCVEDQYSKLRCLVWSFPGSIFCWYIFHPVFDITYLYVALPMGFFFFILFAYTLPDDDEPPSWMIVITIFGVIGGLMWSYLLIGALIDLLEVIGVVHNLDETFLGLTVLAIGNALPDALTTISLCKQGVGVMAISGGYAGQLFGYLVGFGLAMLKLTLKKGPQAFDLFEMKKIKENLLDLAIIGIAFVILTYTFLHGVCNDFKMNKFFAKNLVLMYAVFIVFAFVVAIKHSYGH